MHPDWKTILLPDVSILEIVFRGTVIYLGLFTMLRVVLKRQPGTLGMSDLLLITLLADASQNAMSGQYQSVPDGIILVATIIFWNYALDWLSYRSAWFQRLIEPPPLILVKNGRMIRRHMRQELITEDDLMAHLRQQGLEQLSQVREAFIESDGHISIIRRDRKQHPVAGRESSGRGG